MGFSKEEAGRLHNDSVSPTHLLLAILRHGDNHAKEVLSRHTQDLGRLKAQLEKCAMKHQVSMPPLPMDMNLDTEASRAMRVCILEARLQKSETIEPVHILLAILRSADNEASSVLQDMNITYDTVTDEINGTHTSAQHYEDYEDYEDGDTATADNNTRQRATLTGTGKKASGKTPILDSFGTDLTKAAAEGLLDPMVGRAAEMERLTQILCRRKKNNPILIGLPGVGKTAIVEGLATQIVKHRTSRLLWNKRVVTLDMTNVVAGTKYRGQFEERLQNIMNELKNNPNIIVFIDEIHNIIGAGNAQGSMDAANILKPALSRGEFQCIGATTTEEFRKTIEKDGALDRRFQKVTVEPTSQEETLQILQNLKERYEEHHHVTYTEDALKACVTLTGRYLTDRSFPDKAIDAMDEAGSRTHTQGTPVPQCVSELEAKISKLQEAKNEAVAKQDFELAADLRDQARNAQETLALEQEKWEKSLGDKFNTVDGKDVAQTVSMMTGVPVQRIDQQESTRLRNLKETLGGKVIGQNEAIAHLAKSIQRSRLGLKDPNKPIGTFLFVGPTGVGKTYLAKCLAEELFGTPDSIIRIDMSEYMEKHTVSRMVGAPPGYVGHEDGGQLTEKVRRKPYSIVLFDEIEKAHSDVFNILLQVMDEGRMTDGNGTTVDFRNTVIVMTSNCGTKQMSEFGHGLGFAAANDTKSGKDIISKALKKQFAPEFLNRLDDIIYFDQLDEDAIRRIVDIELAPLLQRISDMGRDLCVDNDSKRLLGKKGYNAQYGARPLKRAIQSLIEDPLCDILLADNPPTMMATRTNGDKIEIVEAGK